MPEPADRGAGHQRTKRAHSNQARAAKTAAGCSTKTAASSPEGPRDARRVRTKALVPVALSLARRGRLSLLGSIGKERHPMRTGCEDWTLACCSQYPSNEAATRHLHGVQHRLRLRLGRDPRPCAAPAGSSDPEHASNRVRRVVDGMDVGHDRPDRLSTATTANARGREEAPDRVERTGRTRPHQHHPLARGRQAPRGKRAGHLRHQDRPTL